MGAHNIRTLTKCKCELPDGARPTCLRCKQSGFGCDGYKATEFINETVTDRFRFQCRQQSSASASASAERNPQLPVEQQQQQQQSMTFSARRLGLGLGLELQLQQHPPISLWPMRDGICLSYMRNTLFDTDPRDEPAGVPAWIGFRAADDVDEESGLPRLPLSLQCLQALAKAYLGRVQGAPGVSREGSRLYVASLARLNRELRLLRPAPAPSPPDDRETSTLAAQRRRSENRNRSESPSEGETGGGGGGGDADNVLAILILGAYEMFVLSSSTGWIDHALGLGSVLEMRGPHAFVADVAGTSTNGHNSNSNSNNLAHTLLESSRFLIILASLAVSKRTFLSRDEWKTIPWSKSRTKSKKKSPANMLLDIFADLPGLKEQRERERGRQRGGRGRRRHDEDSRPCDDDDDLRAKASNIINDLLSWRRMWESSPEGHITTKDLSAVDAVLSFHPQASLPRASSAAASPPSSHFKFFDST
ncbi:hypothetical protein LTR46_007479, partial [Exophiala xenobiotica]